MTWLTDVNGVEIGIEMIDTPDDRHLRLVVPDLGLDQKLDKNDAARLIALLKDGLAFAEITGSDTFSIFGTEI